MKKIVIIFFLLLIKNSIWADSFDCKQDYYNGDNRLQTLQDSYRKVKTLQAKFEQRSYMSALQVEERSSGIIWLEKPGLMKWHYQLPEEYFYLIKEQTFTQYLPLDQQVTINDFGEVTISDLPTSFLMGLGELEEEFKLEKACLTNSQEILLFMTPKKLNNQEAGLSKLNLLVNPSDSSLVGAQIIDLTDNITEIKLNEIMLNLNFKPDVFNLTYPNDTFINDNRRE